MGILTCKSLDLYKRGITSLAGGSLSQLGIHQGHVCVCVSVYGLSVHLSSCRQRVIKDRARLVGVRLNKQASVGRERGD